MDDKQLMYLFHRGECSNLYDYFGATLESSGVTFRVYAPNARNVQLLGGFNNWQPEWMTKDESGVFTLHVETAKEYDLYKLNIEGADGSWNEKTDPFATYSEMRPKVSSVVCSLNKHQWQDSEWIANRDLNYDKPMNIYELNIGSWRKHQGQTWYNYQDLIEQLIPYLKEHGYTHIELMPLSEHPFDGSWGYQVSGYFSATSRYGDPKELMRFIDICHQNKIGVIMDFVPVHFVKDATGLIRFDGSPLYEYNKSEDAYSEWGTMNFDLWKEDVRSFLLSAASFWLDKYHIDGLRFDAVANLIFWGGNKQRGANQGALDFIKRCNYLLHERFPQVMLIAEDSSDYPGVTKPTFDGGLGFDYKWDMGWMNDTLKYFKTDPIYRGSIHHQLTFSMAYFYADRFLLPLSHDEVVHGKGAIVNKMWGSYEQKIAQAKNLYLYQMTHPGKKLNFMGNEFAHFREWDEDKEMDWFLLSYPVHDTFKRYIRDLNMIYHHHPELSAADYQFEGFKWIDADNSQQSIYSYYRTFNDEVSVVVLNMTPIGYHEFHLGVPQAGEYYELINSERDIYGGCNMTNYEPMTTFEHWSHQLPNTIRITIAPFSAMIIKLKPTVKIKKTRAKKAVK